METKTVKLTDDDLLLILTLLEQRVELIGPAEKTTPEFAEKRRQAHALWERLTDIFEER
jgi:hypothetical protein